MLLDFTTLDARQAYYWMGSTITPRPVAWVSSCSADGVANLAPFSFFQMVTASPPTLMISPLLQADKSLKDTARNIQETGEFVVNLVPFALVEMMNQTSMSLEPSLSEIEQFNVPTLPSERVKPRRVAGVPVSFECRLAKFMPYPEHQPSCVMILGKVLAAHIDERIVAEDGTVDPAKLDTVSRMGADWYGRTQSEANFKLTRPTGWDRRRKTRD